MYKNIIDLTNELYNGMPTYPNLPDFKIDQYSTLINDHARSSIMKMLTHHGTHIDAPAHILEYGNTISNLDIEHFITNCVILNVIPGHRKITRIDLDTIDFDITKVESILINTGWYKNRDKANYTSGWFGLDKNLAEYLSNFKLKFIGIDGLSIASPPSISDITEIVDVHRLLLQKNIYLIEELNFKDLKSKNNVVVGKLFVAPLKLINADGAPARVYFMPEK